MLKNLNPSLAIVLSTLLWGTWWYPLRLLNEYANNNAIPLTLSFMLAGFFLLSFSLRNVHLLTKKKYNTYDSCSDGRCGCNVSIQ